MWDSLSAFYNSAEWKNLRLALIAERVNSYGETICAECSKPILNGYDCIAHHEQPITLSNVNDFSVSLNPTNIKLLHARCHNAVHKRFGFCAERKVYFVYGSPCSGKNTFVDSIKGNSDLVVDMDNIWQCITGGERYHKPNALKTNAFMVRDCLLDMVKTRAGKWEKAYIITGAPRKGDRDRQIAVLGAEPIFIDTPREICLQRLATDEKRNFDEWSQYIDQWWNDYQE